MFNFDKALGMHAQVLPMRAKRADVLAQNVANAMTPNYQAKDFDINAAIKSLKEDQRPKVKMSATHPGHIIPQNLPGTMEMKFRVPTMPSHDGNTVDVNKEKMEYSKNLSQYMVSMQFVSGSIKGLRKAIKGGE